VTTRDLSPTATESARRAVGEYDPGSDRSVLVKVLGCESVGTGAVDDAFEGVTTLLETAVGETVLEGAAIRQYDVDVDFGGLDGAAAYHDRADASVDASVDDAGADLRADGGANLWVTAERTTAHPVDYSPSVYAPSYDRGENDSYPHAWGESKFACTHELGHLLVNTTEDIPANREPLSADPFEYECGEGDYCHRDHTLATTVDLGATVGVTIMSRPGNEAEHKLGECAGPESGDEQLFYGSACFHAAVDNTVRWSNGRAG